MDVFGKYAELMTSRPNGRPVGVKNGDGERPQQYNNPALDGLKHVGGGGWPNPSGMNLEPKKDQPPVENSLTRIMNLIANRRQ